MGSLACGGISSTAAIYISRGFDFGFSGVKIAGEHLFGGPLASHSPATHDFHFRGCSDSHHTKSPRYGVMSRFFWGYQHWLESRYNAEFVSYRKTGYKLQLTPVVVVKLIQPFETLVENKLRFCGNLFV